MDVETPVLVPGEATDPERVPLDFFTDEITLAIAHWEVGANLCEKWWCLPVLQGGV